MTGATMILTRVRCLKIKTFRRFKDIEISVGSNVTLIAGQNGTLKSTLLGMMAQPFSFGVIHGKTVGKPDKSSYTNTYHGLVLSDNVDFSGKHFMYDCDNVFRLSKQHDLNEHKYQYMTVLDTSDLSPHSPLEDDALHTQNRGRSTVKGVRFVTGPGASHKAGEGNYPHPVIYLGLNRLWPLAQAKQCTFTKDSLSPADKKWYVEKYNEILCLEEYDNGARFMDTSEKRKFITPEGEDYDGESCSAGQDNLGQLLTAILSFKRLKADLGTKYRGGLLLIDELDATLHAFAQDKLLELLCDISDELGLQIVGTTHSLRMLEKAYKSSSNQKTEVIYLLNIDSQVSQETFETYEDLSDHLKVESTPSSAKKPKKVSIVFEDKEGQWLFQQICGSKLKNYISVRNTTSLGAGYLKNLGVLSTILSELRELILVPDGDMGNAWVKPPKNLLALPGGKRPETLVYQHLHAMKESDPFWKSISKTYTKQFAITSKEGSTRAKGDSKKWVKKWYKKQSEYWGRGNLKVFKSWAQANRSECLKFCEEFVKLLKTRYKGEIPKSIIEKTLAQFR